MDPVYSLIEEEITQESDYTLLNQTPVADLDSFDFLVAYDTDIQRWHRRRRQSSSSGDSDTYVNLSSLNKNLKTAQGSDVKPIENHNNFNGRNHFEHTKSEGLSAPGTVLTPKESRKDHSHVEQVAKNSLFLIREIAKKTQHKTDAPGTVSLNDPNCVRVKGHMSETGHLTDSDSVVSGSGGEGGSLGVYRGVAVGSRGLDSPSALSQTSGGSRSSSFSFLSYNQADSQPVHFDTSYFPQRDLHHLAEEAKRRRAAAAAENVSRSSTSSVGSGDGISSGSRGVGRNTPSRRDSQDSSVFQPIISEEEALSDITLDGEPSEQVIPRDGRGRVNKQREPAKQSVEELSKELSDLEKEIKRLVVDLSVTEAESTDIDIGLEDIDSTEGKHTGTNENMEAVMQPAGQEDISSRLNGTEGGDLHSGNGSVSPDIYKNANIDVSKLVNSVIADDMRSAGSSQSGDRPLSAGSTNETLQALARTSGSLALQQSSIGNPNIKPATAEQIATVIANAEREYREKKQQLQQQQQQLQQQQQQAVVETQIVTDASDRTSNNTELAGSVHEPPTKLPAPESFKPLQTQPDIGSGGDELSPDPRAQTPSASVDETNQQNDSTEKEASPSGGITPKSPATVKTTPSTLVGQNTGLAVMSAVGSKYPAGEERVGALYRSPVESIIATKSVKDTIVSGGKDSAERSSKKSKKTGSHKKNKKSTEIPNLSLSLETVSNASEAGSQAGSTAPSRESSIAGSAPHSPKSDGKPRSGSFFSSIFSWRGNREDGQYAADLPQHEADRFSAGDGESGERRPEVGAAVPSSDPVAQNETRSDSGIDLNQAHTPDHSDTSSRHGDGGMSTPHHLRSTPRQGPKPGYVAPGRLFHSGQTTKLGKSGLSYHGSGGFDSQDTYSLMREKALLEGQLETLTSEAGSAIKERAELQSQVAALKVQLRNQHSTAESAVQERSALAVDLDTLKQNRAELQQKIIELQSNLENKDSSIRKLTAEIKSAQESNEKLFQKLEQLRINITTKETSISMLKEKIATTQHELAAAQQEASQSSGEIASLETDMQALLSTKEWFQDQLRQAQEAKGKLQQDLAKARTNAVMQGTMIENLKTENARIRQQLTETQQKALLEKEMLAKHLEAIENDMRNREAAFEQMHRERQAAEEAVNLKMMKVEEDKSQLTNLITSSVQLEQQLEKTNRELYVKEAALAVLEEEKKELVKRLTLAQESITSRDHQIESLETKCVDLEVKLKEMRIETSSQDELMQQLKEEKIALESALAIANKEKRSFDNACQNLQTDMTKVEKSFKQMKQELQSKVTQLEEVEREKQEVKVKLEDAKRQLAEEKKTAHSYSVDAEGKGKLVEELKNSRGSLEGEVSAMAKRIQHLENNYQAVQLEKESLEKEVTGTQESISDLKSELQTALEGKAHLEGQIEMMSAERETYSVMIEENNWLKQTLAEQQSMSHREIAEQKARLLRLNSDLNSAQKELREKQRSYDSTVGTLTRKLKEATENRQRAELELQSVHSQVQSVKADQQEMLEAEVQSLKVELETAHIRKQTLETELHELQVRMVDDTNEYSSRIARLERDLQTAREHNEHQKRAEDFNRKMALELERERGRLAGVKQSHDALKHHTSVLETALARRESSLTEVASQLETLKQEKEEEERKMYEKLDELERQMEQERSAALEYKRRMNAETEEKNKLQRQAQVMATDLEQLQHDLDSKSKQLQNTKDDITKAREGERQQRAEKEQLQLHLKGSRLQVDRLKRQLEEKEAQDPVLNNQMQTLTWENEQFQHEVEALREQLSLAEKRQQIEIDSIRSALQTSKTELESLRHELSSTRKEKFMYQAKMTELKGILKATVQQNKMLKSQLQTQSSVDLVSTGTQSLAPPHTSNQEVQHDGEETSAADASVPELTQTAETALQAINTDQLISNKDDSKPLLALKSCLSSLKEQMSLLQNQMDEHTSVVQNSSQSWRQVDSQVQALHRTCANSPFSSMYSSPASSAPSSPSVKSLVSTPNLPDVQDL